MKAKFVTKGGKSIPIQFNPSEYSINTRDTSIENRDKGKTIQGVVKTQLSMNLVYDTYMSDLKEKEDVRSYTEPIIRLGDGFSSNRPEVTFVWGSLEFTGIVESATQKFTMFTTDGKPVRAELSITMTGTNTSKVKIPDAKIKNFKNNSWKDKEASKSPKELRELLSKKA